MARRVRFTIKTPKHKGRASFSIASDIIDEDSGRSHKVVRDERLDAINLSFSKGKPYEECLLLVREVQKDLYQQEKRLHPTVVHNAENFEILAQYFKRKYERRRNVREESKRTMHYDLVRAVEAIGHLSLYSASEEQLQDEIGKRARGTKQRRIVMRLRQLLKFINRHDVRLELDYEDDRQVRFLEMEEIDQLIHYFDAQGNNVMKCLVAIGAKCGLRLGEIYALEIIKIKGRDRLVVDGQLIRDGSRRKPKRDKIRDAYVIGDAMKYVREWCRLPIAEKTAYRRGQRRIPDAVTKACRALWPDEPRKHLNFHDTRHCYGVYLVSKGISTDLVAKSLGNSPEVCRKYYQGFILSDTAMATIRAILS